MICRDCQIEMDELIKIDEPEKCIAYDVHVCPSCLVLAKIDTYKNTGTVWVYPDNRMFMETVDD